MIDSFKGPYRFLSNFYQTEVVYEGVTYSTSEHAYQAAKSVDLAVRAMIAKITDPSDAKRRGQSIKARPDWDLVKLAIMKAILRIKFSDEDLRGKLLETGEQELVEGNYWGDVYWGVCRGSGLNHLGKLLMEVREELRNAKA